MINLDGCGFSNTTVDATDVLYNITFYIFLPYYLTMGLLSNIFLIVNLAKQAKSEKGFIYQLLVVVSKTFENICFGLFLAGAYWFAGFGGIRSEWFISNYTLMFITMRLLQPAFFFGIFLSLFSSVVMTLDRVIALSKPFIYKNINHRRYRNIVYIVSVSVSIGLCIDYYWYYNIITDQASGYYVITTNKVYIGTHTAHIFESIRIVIRSAAVIILIILNLIMVISYNRRMKKLNQISMSSQEKSDSRKEANRELLILSICQSCLILFEQIPHGVMQAIRHQSDFWSKCGLVMAPEADGAPMMADSMKFFIMVLVNRKIRRDMVKLCKWGRNQSRVGQLNGGSLNRQPTNWWLF